MIISIIGMGRLGTVIADSLIDSEFEILLSDRKQEKAIFFANELGNNFLAVTNEEAINRSKVIILTLGLIDQMAFINTYYEKLNEKIIIDPSNPVNFAPHGVGRKILPSHISSGEIIKNMLPNRANYVKAFGTLSAKSLHEEAHKKDPRVLFFSTKNIDVVRIVQLIIEAAGFQSQRVVINKSQDFSLLEFGGEFSSISCAK